jgi:hypothetical protein
MGCELDIPRCIYDPAHPIHPPPFDKPLRIQIEGHLVLSIPCYVDSYTPDFPQPAAHELARLTYRVIYGQDGCPEVIGDVVVRDEYLSWVMSEIPRK